MIDDLKKYCFTNNELGDNFVGIRSLNNNLQICFPLGFDISDNKTIRTDIKKLILVLLKNNKAFAFDRLMNGENKIISSSFPIIAYKNIIEHFLSFGYCTENQNTFENNTKGKINFLNTIKKNKPLVQVVNNKNSFVYTKFQVKKKITNENELITAINKYCVYEAFSKIGFIFSLFMPPKFKLPASKNYCIHLLENKLHSTFNDNKRILFNSMKNTLLQSDNSLNESSFKFGTYYFYAIWEKMIDKAFGIKNKEEFFPKSKWTLYFSDEKDNYPLQPDSIMFFNDKIFILDAKYYKYGISKNINDLPNSSSIIKQIVYGEYLAKSKAKNEVYNAFLMPYNKLNNPFRINQNFKNIGFANGEWRTNLKKYENIQGILIDTKFLMQNYDRQCYSKLREYLSKSIEKKL